MELLRRVMMSESGIRYFIFQDDGAWIAYVCFDTKIGKEKRG